MTLIADRNHPAFKTAESLMHQVEELQKMYRKLEEESKTKDTLIEELRKDNMRMKMVIELTTRPLK